MQSNSVSRASSSVTIENIRVGSFSGSDTESDARFDGIPMHENAETFRQSPWSKQVMPETSLDFFANEPQSLTLKQKLLRMCCCR